MSRVERSRREKVTRYSVRKVSFGAASVAVAAFFMFLGNGAVYAAEPNVTATDSALAATPANNQVDENSGASDSTAPKGQADTTTPAPADASSTSVESSTVSKGQADATTSKPADATPAPVVSSTTSATEETAEGKETVGKKASNTEKATGTNSIANSGKHDPRNGKALDTNNPFRTGTDANPSTTVSTDPLAVNETPKNAANQYFDEGVEKPTGNEKLKLQPATNLTGWKFENPNQNKIIIVNGSTTYYGNQMFPSNHRYGIVLGGFTGIGSSTKFDNIGSIYQDIDVVPNSELVLRMRGATFGTQGGTSTYKAEIFDVNNLTTPLGKIDGVRARPAEFSGIVNIPEGVTKVRIKLTDTTPNHKAIGDGRDPYVDIDGVRVYTGAMVANFRASSGSYVVPTVGQTNYTTASESRNQATVETTITVNLENKGGESSQNTIYRVQLPEGATLKENSAQNATATVSNGVLSLNAGAIAAGTTKTISYTLVLPATAPLSKDLQGTVSYQTTNLSILNPTIPRKSGSRALENQNITITMYKADLQAEAAKAATLNQSDYTPEAWATYQAEIAKAQEILNEETNNVAIANRKNQADINAQTLLLQKAQAKLEIDKAKKVKLTAIEGTPNATKEEKDAAKQAAQDAATKADQAIDAAIDNAG
ncbi:SasC/FmtB family protein, partial [Streptococcus oralis]